MPEQQLNAASSSGRCIDCGAPISQWGTRCRGCVNRSRTRPPEERFWEKVMPEPMSGCWLWLGSLNNKGYGKFHIQACRSNPKEALAHRVAFEWEVGAIPSHLELDHLCRNRSCVNPAHLEPVTREENRRRGVYGVVRTHCKRGHELTDENVWVQKGGLRPGRRQCRRCDTIRHQLRGTREKSRA